MSAPISATLRTKHAKVGIKFPIWHMQNNIFPNFGYLAYRLRKSHMIGFYIINKFILYLFPFFFKSLSVKEFNLKGIKVNFFD